MNAASLINFLISKKILKIKNKKLNDLAAKIGSDVVLGLKPGNTILSSNGKIKRFVNKISWHRFKDNLNIEFIFYKHLIGFIILYKGDINIGKS